MGRVLDFLTEEYLEEHYGSRETALRPPTREEVRAPGTLAEAVRRAAGRSLLGEGEVDALVRLARRRGQVARAWDATASELRAIWRAGAAAFEAVLGELDFTPVEVVEDPVTPKRAQALAAAVGARIEPSAEGTSRRQATYTAPPQPQRNTFYEALLCAVLAHDWGLAERLAQGYPTRPAGELVEDYYGHKTGLLRELVLGDDAAARAHLDRLPRACLADPPPDRLELPEGLLAGAEALVRDGLRKISTRFASTWEPRKHEEWARKHHKPLQATLTASRGALIGGGWVLSEWGVAYGSLAARRGLSGLLADVTGWSEWLPRSLCSGEPLADEEPAPRKSRPAGRARAEKPSAPPHATAGSRPVPGPGPTPLHEAVEAEDLDALKALLAAGPDLEARDHRALTPLLRAVWDDNLAAVELLLAAGADPNAVDDRERCGLHVLAFRGGSPAVARTLLARGAAADARLSDGTTPLHLAASPEMLEVLVAAGSNLDAANAHGSTALYRLIHDRKHDLALLLLEKGADPTTARPDGWTPLHEASKQDCRALVSRLIERGADVGAMTAYGITPLHLAAGLRQPGVVELLLERGAEIDARRTEVPDDFAAYVRDPALELVWTGGDQRKRQYNLAAGSTALHFAAVSRGNAEVVSLLLEHGAAASLRDGAGRTPLDCAREHKEAKTIRVLEQVG